MKRQGDTVSHSTPRSILDVSLGGRFGPPLRSQGRFNADWKTATMVPADPPLARFARAPGGCRRKVAQNMTSSPATSSGPSPRKATGMAHGPIRECRTSPSPILPTARTSPGWRRSRTPSMASKAFTGDLANASRSGFPSRPARAFRRGLGPNRYHRPVIPGNATSNPTAMICKQMNGNSDLKMSPSEISGGVTDFR